MVALLVSVYAPTFIFLLTATTMDRRATPSQIRKAATRDLDSLQQALEGWSVDEIDALEDDKNPLHMAAWQGPLENVVYLVENMGCNKNVIATGEFSYGKTPIFFAATRCRRQVVQYLLEQGVFCKIVNNKGQSLRSIAASHDLGTDIMDGINGLEQSQADKWWNFRATHSDGLEYGDLDPRFLERELRETDVVTSFAVNPTSKESRKGSFLRKNPHLTKQKPKQQPRLKKQHAPTLSQEEVNQQTKAWDRIKAWLSSDGSGHDVTSDLLLIVQLKDKLHRPWIPEVATQLKDSATSHARLHQLIQDAHEGASKREINLLGKLLVQLQDPASYGQQKPAPELKSRQQPTVSPVLWTRVCAEIPDTLSMSMLQTDCTSQQIKLSTNPTWIDSVDGVCRVKSTLEGLEARVVSLDTEWYDGDNNGTQLATLQIAVVLDSNVLSSWVIDLINDSNDYKQGVVDLISWIFAEPVLLGFSVHHNDIPMLEDYLGESLPTANLLDLQQVATASTQVPGLASVVANYGASLSKEEQCSNWATRPLSESQMNYAGLDAAVLLILLAEMKRKGLEPL